MKNLMLTNGGSTLVDDDVYEWAKNFNWRRNAKGYAVRSEGSGWDGTIRTIYLSREIVKPVGRQQVDHRNRTPLNNLRRNLRPTAQINNLRNVGLRKDNKSKVKGVYWHIRIGKWCASIQVNKQRLHLGYFSSLKKAKAAYNAAALTHFGEFAYLNP